MTGLAEVETEPVDDAVLRTTVLDGVGLVDRDVLTERVKSDDAVVQALTDAVEDAAGESVSRADDVGEMLLVTVVVPDDVALVEADELTVVVPTTVTVFDTDDVLVGADETLCAAEDDADNDACDDRVADGDGENNITFEVVPVPDTLPEDDNVFTVENVRVALTELLPVADVDSVDLADTVVLAEDVKVPTEFVDDGVTVLDTVAFAEAVEMTDAVFETDVHPVGVAVDEPVIADETVGCAVWEGVLVAKDEVEPVCVGDVLPEADTELVGDALNEDDAVAEDEPEVDGEADPLRVLIADEELTDDTDTLRQLDAVRDGEPVEDWHALTVREPVSHDEPDELNVIFTENVAVTEDLVEADGAVDVEVEAEVFTDGLVDTVLVTETVADSVVEVETEAVLTIVPEKTVVRVAVEKGELDAVGLDVPVGELPAVKVEDTIGEGVGLGVADSTVDAETEAVEEVLPDVVADLGAERETEGECVVETVTEEHPLEEGEVLTNAVRVMNEAVIEAELHGVVDFSAEPVFTAVSEAVSELAPLVVGVAVEQTDTDAVPLIDFECVDETESDDAPVDVCDEIAEAVDLDEPELLGVAVLDEEGEGDADALLESDGMSDGDTVAVAEFVTVFIEEVVGEFDIVLVAEDDPVATSVAVGVIRAVLDPLLEGDAVLDGVGVDVDVPMGERLFVLSPVELTFTVAERDALSVPVLLSPPDMVDDDIAVLVISAAVAV